MTCRLRRAVSTFLGRGHDVRQDAARVPVSGPDGAATIAPTIVHCGHPAGAFQQTGGRLSARRARHSRHRAENSSAGVRSSSWTRDRCATRVRVTAGRRVRLGLSIESRERRRDGAMPADAACLWATRGIEDCGTACQGQRIGRGATVSPDASRRSSCRGSGTASIRS